MAPNWTPCKLKMLLKLFSDNYDCLFNNSLSQRKLRRDTFEIIAKQMDIPFQALKFKYFNLNNAYNAEIKKIEAARQQGFFYRPTLSWFKEYREIMERVDELNKMEDYSAQNMDENNAVTSPNEENIASEEESYFEEDETSCEPSADTIVVSIKQECIDGVKKGSWDVDFEDTIEPVQLVESPKSTPPAPPAPSAQLTRIAHVKKPTKRSLKPDSLVKLDEFQIFANHVAEQLRNMAIYSARKMQNEIHTIFDEEGFPFYSPVLDDDLKHLC